MSLKILHSEGGADMSRIEIIDWEIKPKSPAQR
jgi:hypothetical protein